MTYEELKKIAQPHIRTSDNFPSNAFLMLNQLHISYKTEIQYGEDFEAINLYNKPAFLYIDGDNKTVYFNSKTRYWNFYIFHEIAHVLLGHEDDSPSHEMEADLLACILAAPIENFPSGIKSARDLSVTGNIPIDKAESYWAEIHPKRKSNTVFKISILIIFLTLVLMHTYRYFQQNQTYVFITTSGTKYHLSDCIYVKDKNNIKKIHYRKAKQDGYTPCSICIKK